MHNASLSSTAFKKCSQINVDRLNNMGKDNNVWRQNTEYRNQRRTNFQAYLPIVFDCCGIIIKCG